MTGIRVNRSTTWLLTGIAVAGMNLAGVYRSLQPQGTWIPGPPGAGGSSVSILRMYDGSVVQYRFFRSGGRSGPTLLAGPSAAGLFQVWWPVAASMSASLLVAGFAWRCTRWKSATWGLRPRVTMSQSIAFISLVSFCLWLMRFDYTVVVAGFIVGSLMVHAVYRRKALLEGVEGEIDATQTLSRIGIAGYTVAVVLALAWVICILAWDSYQPGHG
jgi:hypothetical protein